MKCVYNIILLVFSLIFNSGLTLAQDNIVEGELVFIGIRKIERPIILYYTDTVTNAHLGTFIISQNLLDSLRKCPDITMMAKHARSHMIAPSCQFIYNFKYLPLKESNPYLKQIWKDCMTGKSYFEDIIQLCSGLSYSQFSTSKFIFLLINNRAHRRIYFGKELSHNNYMDYYVPLLIPLNND